MDSESRLGLITRNAKEVLTPEELGRLLDSGRKPVVYHGFEPSGSGAVHIGYMIALNKLIDFQKAGLKVTILFADIHAWLNEKGSMEDIRKTARSYERCFRALGLDTRKARPVLGSEFQFRREYTEDVLKLSLKSRLARARRAMDVIGRGEENPHVAQVLYPLMQAADIKHLNADIASGDMPQRKIHMLARELLPSLGHAPPVSIHHEDLAGLTGGKMSSSKPETMIRIDESPGSMRKKISGAFCPPKVMGEENPVFSMARLIIFPKVKRFVVERPRKYGGDAEFSSVKELESAYARGLHPQDLKEAVSRHLAEVLEPARRFLAKKPG